MNIHILIIIKAKVYFNVLITHHDHWLFTYNVRLVNSVGKAKNK